MFEVSVKRDINVCWTSLYFPYSNPYWRSDLCTHIHHANWLYEYIVQDPAVLNMHKPGISLFWVVSLVMKTILNTLYIQKLKNREKGCYSRAHFGYLMELGATKSTITTIMLVCKMAKSLVYYSIYKIHILLNVVQPMNCCWQGFLSKLFWVLEDFVVKKYIY